MCPFILQDTVDDVPVLTNFLVLTTAFFYKNFIKDVVGYAKNLSESGQSVLVFDGSLGLGDLNCASAFCNPDIEAVLDGKKAISVLIKQNEQIDWISGVSKKINLGTCSDIQFCNLLSDLNLLGKNYQNVLIYAPPTLPYVQRFFCQRLDSLCFTQVDEESIAKAIELISVFPQMKCYLNAKKKYLSVMQAIQLTEIAEKEKILYNFTE